MTAIWQNKGQNWTLLSAIAYPDEATLHTLIEQSPELLPLAGSPRLAVLGREVQLGAGWADLIALEPSGRIAIVEIKLARNAEARRAVVAQVLAYAAYLHGVDRAYFEKEILGRHLQSLGYESIREALSAMDQEGAFDPEELYLGMEESLSQGQFRIVIVLDEAPIELIRLVGYLEVIADKLLIDLVTVASYNVDGTTIIVPQRVEPDRQVKDIQPTRSLRRPQGKLVGGSADFSAAIDYAPESERSKLNRLVDWAISLESQGLVQLSTFHGVNNRWTLLPRLKTENVGLITIWNENGAYIQFWRSVFERKAPATLPELEKLIAPDTVRQGNTMRDFDDSLLEVIACAYREAATGDMNELEH